MAVGSVVRVADMTLSFAPGRVQVPTSGCCAGPESAARIVRALLAGVTVEHFIALHLGTRGAVIGVHTVGIGTLSACLVRPADVYKAAMLSNAAAIVCAHNHPSGEPSPSPDDLTLMSRLQAAGSLLDVPLGDFIVIGESSFWSAKLSGVM